MKILVVTDVYGWAFEFAARGIQKHSKHDINVKAHNDIYDFEGYDCVFFMNSSCFKSLSKPVKRLAYKVPNKCVGIRSGLPLMGCDYPILGWKIACVQERTYEFLRKQNPNEKIFLCHNGVDTDVFKFIKRPVNRFKVGWAGNPNQPVKRCHLLTQLEFPVVRAINWGPTFFNKNRNRDPMVKFYESIDVYINVSSQEGFSQTILESAATGLPIVCTDVGGHFKLVPAEWLISPNPEDNVVSIMNDKLKILKESPEKRFEVGKENYEKIMKEWAWKKRAKEYDEMFEA